MIRDWSRIIFQAAVARSSRVGRVLNLDFFAMRKPNGPRRPPAQTESGLIQGDYQINKRWSVSMARDQVGGVCVNGTYHTKF
jgi:hypothetical protein